MLYALSQSFLYDRELETTSREFYSPAFAILICPCSSLLFHKIGARGLWRAGNSVVKSKAGKVVIFASKVFSVFKIHENAWQCSASAHTPKFI